MIEWSVVLILAIVAFPMWWLMEKIIRHDYFKALKFIFYFFVPIGIVMVVYEMYLFRGNLDLWLNQYAYGLIALSISAQGIVYIFLGHMSLKVARRRHEKGKRVNMDAVTGGVKLITYLMVFANFFVYFLMGKDFIKLIS